MLSPLSYDGLGISRSLRYPVGCCKLGCYCQCNILCVPALVMGCSACGEDKPPLSERVPYDSRSSHECTLMMRASSYPRDAFLTSLIQLGFVIPLAAQPEQCYNTITPNNMHTSPVCGASGAFLILGGWAGVMWVFLRSLSLHLQICWQVLVGRNFMIFSQAAGWGVPIIGVILAILFSGLSFRFGATCHINHKNSLADFWIPLLAFAGLTVIITFVTFGYCIKVYLASLSDHSESTEGSGLPTLASISNSMSPRQAYRRVRRVIGLQWRGIAIVLIIIADVIFFSVIFVFQDNVVQSVTTDPTIAEDWSLCLIANKGDKNACLSEAGHLVVNEATVTAVLLLLAVSFPG